jgi:hypothetical protein
VNEKYISLTQNKGIRLMLSNSSWDPDACAYKSSGSEEIGDNRVIYSFVIRRQHGMQPILCLALCRIITCHKANLILRSITMLVSS